MSISIKDNPRKIALDILIRIEKERSYADALINQAISTKNVGEGGPFLTILVYGVLQQKGRLDYSIEQLTKKKIESLDLPVLTLLRLGLFQIIFLDSIPDFAAVSETVNLSKQVAPRASGLVNAILRNYLRNKDTIKYPDSQRNSTKYIATYYSQPELLVRSWLTQLEVEETMLLAEAMNKEPPLTFRTNTLKITRSGLITKLTSEGIKAKATKYSPDGIIVSSPVNIAKLASYQEGLLTVQDESSQLASIFLSPLPGDKVLDLCAAPGGKATHLAQLMKNRGEIVANDVDKNKLRYISSHATRLGVTILTTSNFDAHKSSPAPSNWQFDKILIDAPCPGTGVIRRNPETKWWLNSEDLKVIAEKQKTILTNAANWLVPDGTILYATCSTTREENEDVIEHFLSIRRDFAREDLSKVFPKSKDLFTNEGYFRSWPHRQGMDGFFAAKLRKVRE